MLFFPNKKKNTVNNKSVKTNLDTMTFLSRKFKDAIQQGKIDRDWINFARRMDVKKKRLATKITNQSIDQYYNKAIQLGAKGGKLLGSGGRFLLFCARKNIKIN